jgi:hypothetical protein
VCRVWHPATSRTLTRSRELSRLIIFAHRLQAIATLADGIAKPDQVSPDYTRMSGLYELYHATLKTGQWSADSAAIWDMTINEQRPYTWTSADAAGLPVFVGLARYDEVAAGAVNHALRFTIPTTQKAFVLPATHWASTTTDPNAPPMAFASASRHPSIFPVIPRRIR